MRGRTRGIAFLVVVPLAIGAFVFTEIPGQAIGSADRVAADLPVTPTTDTAITTVIDANGG